MNEQITVGYDGTDSSAEAVMWAANEAGVRDARLRIVSCYEIPYAGEAIGAWMATEAVASLLEATDKSANSIRDVVAAAQPGLEISVEISAGPASIVLLNGVGSKDLVVVGASSQGGLAAFWLGSTPRHVVRHSPCPVVVVRGAASRGRPDRIVVGVDGSATSGQAVRWAADEADLHKTELVVVHGWSYPYLVAETGSAQARDLTRIDGACVLERAVDLARERGGAEVIGQLVEGSPVSALLDHVRDGDLLVVGSHGRGAVLSSIFGSTVNSVLERSAVPVVVVRTDGTAG